MFFYEDGQRAFDGGVKEAGAKVTILGVQFTNESYSDRNSLPITCKSAEIFVSMKDCRFFNFERLRKNVAQIEVFSLWGLFGTRMKRVNYLFSSGRYASEVQLFIEFEYESCM